MKDILTIESITFAINLGLILCSTLSLILFVIIGKNLINNLEDSK
jgi:hypothetical protein